MTRKTVAGRKIVKAAPPVRTVCVGCHVVFTQPAADRFTDPGVECPACVRAESDRLSDGLAARGITLYPNGKAR